MFLEELLLFGKGLKTREAILSYVSNRMHLTLDK